LEEQERRFQDRLERVTKHWKLSPMDVEARQHWVAYSQAKDTKYWFSVSPEEQERRFQDRLERVTKHWKLSPMDIEARQHWVAYSQAKDTMFAYTDTKQAPWYVVDADDKRRARLNCISHLLSMIPYQDVIPRVKELPARADAGSYVRPPLQEQTFVPAKY